jgi:hypothetical protein
MGPLDLLNHLLNFVAPACVVGFLLALAARWLHPGRSRHAFMVQVGSNVAAGLLALIAGLVLFGRDGKMASYAALVVLSATSQWLLIGGWRK